MAKKTEDAGSLYLRGNIWWVKVSVNSKPIRRSSNSTKRQDAIKLRDQLVAKRHRGELTGGTPDTILVGALLDDLLVSDIEESTRYVWSKVVEKSLRPFFGHRRASTITTDILDEYRKKRVTDGCKDSTANRELSMVRTAFHNARKRTPPKINVIPHFPMKEESVVRIGFLADDKYAAIRDGIMTLGVRALFVSYYETGIRKGELLPVRWSEVDFESNLMQIQNTKNGEWRSVPIVRGDMRNLLVEMKRERDESWPDSPWVFHRNGKQIRDFRGEWSNVVKAVGVPDLLIHDMRRTAVRNMRRAKVPQVIRMKISGHKTDSMERRYNIVDADDIEMAADLMAKRVRTA
jgi:integrase